MINLPPSERGQPCPWEELEATFNYKFLAEAFVDLFVQPMGIESWTPKRMEAVARAFERIGHPETAEHLRKGYKLCLEKRSNPGASDVIVR